jgi:hypothetical protein
VELMIVLIWLAVAMSLPVLIQVAFLGGVVLNAARCALDGGVGRRKSPCKRCRPL